jgi:hypothetical protein
MVVVVVVVIIRGEAEEEAKAEREFDFVRSFYDVDDFVPCEQTHFWPAKTSSLPSFFGNAYKVPFLPSFLPSFETLTRFRSFLPFQWCGIERGREDVHKVCGCERERECICYFSIIEGLFF